MTKKELVKKISEETGYTQKDVLVVVDGVFNTIADVVKTDEVSITGFGKFLTVEKAERVMRNPATGAQVTVPAKKSIRFRPAKLFKDSVNA